MINYKNISNTYLFDSNIAWKTAVIFSWIHWDEVSGIFATQKFINQLNDWKIVLNSWRLIVVTNCNEIAIEKGIRYENVNLNRLFFKWKKWNSYEEKRSEELMKILDEADYFLDLHSTSWPSIPFLFSEIKNFEIAKKLWISNIIWWWAELENWIISWDTENYVNNLWWVWFTFEAGNHEHPDWWNNAYQMLLNFLSYLEVIDKKYFKKIWNEELFIKITDFYKAKTDIFKYRVPIENFTKLSKWTLIWTDSWLKIFAEKDIILIMAKDEKVIEKWIEVFFIWEEIL